MNPPIRRVTLFKHGLGHFEREAEITGDGEFEFAVRRDDVADVLKSLAVIDHDGGTVESVEYDADRPVEELLAEVNLAIEAKDSLQSLLPQLCGARVRAEEPGREPAEGLVIGVDRVHVSSEKNAPSVPRLSLLTDAGKVATFDLFSSRVQILDAALLRDLEHYMTALVGGKKKAGKTFRFRAKGDGTRRIGLSYAVEAAVWKATYRVILRGDEKPLLQGWAVVDNATDDDWEGVQLALVSGLPVSFRHDLYSARKLTRPEVKVAETTGLLPPEMEAAFDAPQMYAPVGGARGLMAAAPSMVDTMSFGMADSDRDEGESRKARKRSSASSVQVQTQQRALGDLFEYAIQHPVSIGRNRSALVPIVNQEFEGRAVLLYQEKAFRQNPVRAVEFHNTTGLTLEGGPATILDGDTYVGEAMLDVVKPSGERLLAFAAELGVNVTTSVGTSRDKEARATVWNGQLRVERREVRKTTYTVKAGDSPLDTLFIDHPRQGNDWELVDLKADSVTETYWRLKFPLAAGQQTLVVEQDRSEVETLLLGSVTRSIFDTLLSRKALTPSLSKILDQAAALNLRREELIVLERGLINEGGAIHQEQTRIQGNLSKLGTSDDERQLRGRYVKTLSTQEDRLEQITRELNAINAERQKLAQQLAALEAELAAPGGK